MSSNSLATAQAGDASRLPFNDVVVVGAGLIGGSVAAAASAAGIVHVTLVDSEADVRSRARARNLAHAVTADLRGAVAAADLVVVAVPASATVDVVAEVAAASSEAAVITDVASLKGQLVPEVEVALQDLAPQRFVGGHPMAGSERSGPEAADAALFQGATWVLTPTKQTDHVALQRLSAFLRGIGARVLALPPDRHDELVAIVSHLPQVAASALADVAAGAAATAGEAVLAVAGGGFRDTTRIAASDPALWLGILRGNRAAVLEALATFGSRLRNVQEALEREDWDALDGFLTRASQARRELVGKADVVRAVDLVVPLDDRPGALAAATTALGESGVNIEDLAMRHAADGTRGSLLVRVDAQVAEHGLAALHARGIAAHVEDLEAGDHVVPRDKR